MKRDQTMQRQATRKTERTLTKKGTGKSHWDAQQQEAFGNVLHKRFPLGSAVPPDVDPELLRPGVDNSFLNDDIKELLGIPVNRKPHMALVDSHVLSEYLRQVGGSVERLDELLGVYDGISGNTPGAAQDRMHTIIENSVRFASQIKGGVHLPLTAVCKWLHYQQQDLERGRELDEEDDDYDLDDLDAELEDIKVADAKRAEEEAAAREAAEAVPAYYNAVDQRMHDPAHQGGARQYPIPMAPIARGKVKARAVQKKQSTVSHAMDPADDSLLGFSPAAVAAGSPGAVSMAGGRKAPGRLPPGTSMADLPPEEASAPDIGSMSAADKDSEIERLRLTVNQHRMKVIEVRDEATTHQHAAHEALTQAQDAQALVGELTRRLAEAGLPTSGADGEEVGPIGRVVSRAETGATGPQAPGGAKVQAQSKTPRRAGAQADGKPGPSTDAIEGPTGLDSAESSPPETPDTGASGGTDEGDEDEASDGGGGDEDSGSDEGVATGGAAADVKQRKKTRGKKGRSKASATARDEGGDDASGDADGGAPRNGGRGGKKAAAARKGRGRSRSRAHEGDDANDGGEFEADMGVGEVAATAAEGAAGTRSKSTGKSRRSTVGKGGATRADDVDASPAQRSGGASERRVAQPPRRTEKPPVTTETVTKSVENGVEVITKVVEKVVEVHIVEERIVEVEVERIVEVGARATQSEAQVLNGRIAKLQQELKAKNALLARFQQDNGEMQQAIQEVMTTLSVDVMDEAVPSLLTAQPPAGAVETGGGARRPSVAHRGGLGAPLPPPPKEVECPLCKQLKEQLRYWREREWMQKTRDDQWAKIRKKQAEIPVNVNSKWAGALVEGTDADADADALSSTFGGTGGRRSTAGGGQDGLAGLGGLGMGLGAGTGMRRSSVRPLVGFPKPSLHAARLSASLSRLSGASGLLNALPVESIGGGATLAAPRPSTIAGSPHARSGGLLAPKRVRTASTTDVSEFRGQGLGALDRPAFAPSHAEDLSSQSTDYKGAAGPALAVHRVGGASGAPSSSEHSPRSPEQERLQRLHDLADADGRAPRSSHVHFGPGRRSEVARVGVEAPARRQRGAGEEPSAADQTAVDELLALQKGVAPATLRAGRLHGPPPTLGGRHARGSLVVPKRADDARAHGRRSGAGLAGPSVNALDLDELEEAGERSRMGARQVAAPRQRPAAKRADAQAVNLDLAGLDVEARGGMRLARGQRAQHSTGGSASPTGRRTGDTGRADDDLMATGQRAVSLGTAKR